jgi:uncharacterized membrane protein YccC
MPRLSGSWRLELRYCMKVGIAAGLGYALTMGNHNQYAIHSAFTAALIVGTSVGEDLATSANRLKGTVVGVAAAMVTTLVFGPNALTVGAAAALTTFVALAGGWGIPVARVGVTVCIITLVMHDGNALRYDFLRTANTLVGAAAGLAVSFFVWPVHGPEQITQATRQVVATSTHLLDAIEAGKRRLRPEQAALHDAIAALVKAWRDLNRERTVAPSTRMEEAKIELVLRLGIDVLACTLSGADAASTQQLRQRIHSTSGQG